MGKKKLESMVKSSVKYLIEGAVLAAKERYDGALEHRAAEYAVEREGKLTKDQYEFLFHCIHWFLYSSPGEYGQKKRLDRTDARRSGDKQYWKLLNPREFFNNGDGPRKDFDRTMNRLAECAYRQEKDWFDGRYASYMDKGGEINRTERVKLLKSLDIKE